MTGLPEIELRINQAAQQLLTKDRAMMWFDSLSAVEKQTTLRACIVLIKESKPESADLIQALQESGVNNARAMYRMVEKAASRDYRNDIWRLANAQPCEQKDAFWIAVRILAIADLRRRLNQCASGCSHWWHGALDDPRLEKGMLEGRYPDSRP